ncbi:cytochrome P450 [Aspergillus nidulans var. acristatus]
MLPPLPQLVAAAALGLLAHWGFFVHGEHDLAAANIARIHLAAAVMKTCSDPQSTWLEACKHTLILSAAYIATLLSSIIFYRILLSPLNHIDGPFALRLTKLSHVWKQARYRNCEFLHELHKRYGDIVRTGPNEVTAFGIDAFNTVHGKTSRCGRAAYYDILHPMVSLDTTRDPEVHAQKRKVWDQAFSVKALEKLEPLIYSKADLLVSKLRDQDGTPVDVSTWLEFYTFDLMGEFGLTIKFANLDRGRAHPILTLFHLAHRMLGPLAAAPWIKHLLMGIPFIERIRYYKQFMQWADSELQRNITEVDDTRTDIIGYVLDDARANGGIERNWQFVLGDFALVITAGSDPMRQVLVNMLYYLLCSPCHLSKLRDELASVDIRNYKALQHLPHLNACIYETLRLYPAVPSAGLRLAPPGGIYLAGKFIPEGTTVVVPQYSLFRDERNFIRPLEWIPERFSTMPGLIVDKQAFVPWSIGKYACIGKNLSLMEMRVAAALILTAFEVEFAPGEDGTRMFSEAVDYFTTTPGPLLLVLKPRGWA